jgi:putative hemolysin
MTDTSKPLSASKPLSDLRLSSLLPNTRKGKLAKIVSPLIDRILGLHTLQKMYLEHGMSGLDKQEFSLKLLSLLGVNLVNTEDLKAKIPKEGPCIVVCNHPYGMVEGVIVAHLLTAVRADTKVMANVALKVFKEIDDYFIYANPLKPSDPVNLKGIKQCFKHLKSDGLLVIFPAGRVSSFQEDKQRITDAKWNRLTIQLASKTNAPILPVFISGSNSALFHRLGRIYYRLRLLMLVREMLKLQRHKISLTANNLLNMKMLKPFENQEIQNDVVRLQCYLNDPDYLTSWPADQLPEAFENVIQSAEPALIQQELLDLPDDQHLLDFKSFSVYYGYQKQIPTCVQEITRLREITFRTLNEGSGEACDTDKYDATYMHLFIYDNENREIIGAYRIGQTDLLQKNGSLNALYLSQMFTFDSAFINQQEPCLEMGRSFIVEHHQNSFYGLLLLWKGIGAFICKNPQYRTLYGTVSLSKLYDPRSVALIDEIMVTDRQGVHANIAFEGSLHPEALEFLKSESWCFKHLSALVQGIETDGKDVPVLLKQYNKLNAVFHCIGIDSNFNQTPGLLLSVNMAEAPDKLLNIYLGEGKEAYVNYQK